MNPRHCPACGAPLPAPPGPALTVDCILRNATDAVLLIRRRNPPHGWALPGGFVDAGETVEAAVVREVREETGLALRDPQLWGVYSDPTRDPRQHTVSVVFHAMTTGTPQAGDDAAQAHFFAPEHLPTPLAFDHRRILDDFWARSADVSRD